MKRLSFITLALCLGVVFSIFAARAYESGRLVTVVTAHGNETNLSVNTKVGNITLNNGDQVIIGHGEAITPDKATTKTLSEFDPSVQVDSIDGAVETSTTVEAFSKVGTFERIFDICESVWDYSRLLWATNDANADVEYWNDYRGGSELIVRDEIRGAGFFLKDQNPAVAGTWYDDRSASTGRSVLPGAYNNWSTQGPGGTVRSTLLTTAYDMRQMSSLIGKPGKLRIRIVLRSGYVAVGVTDIVVKRMGGPSNVGLGVFTRALRTVDSGKPFSPDECPGSSCPIPTPTVTPTPTPTATPTPTPTPVPTPGSGCGITICFRNLDYWLKQSKYPNGAVLIGGVNFNNPTSNTQSIRQALLGGTSDLQTLNQQFVAGQLSVIAVGGEGSPNVVSAYRTALSCYNAVFPPQTLSNGRTISGESPLADLVTQTWVAIKNSQTSDYAKLALIWKALNEPRVVLATCPN